MKKNIIVLWGWTSGWLSALYLSHHIDLSRYSIKLITSESLWTIWVWESTIPHIKDFLSSIWISEEELLVSTNGTIKMWIKFENWNPDQAFNHPFIGWLTSLYIHKVNFAVWFKKYFPHLHYDAYADICSSMFEEEKIVDPHYNKNYAYHLDSSLLAQLLKEKSITAGVEYINTYMKSFTEKDGKIISIETDKASFECDFLVDCSWFHSKILSRNTRNKFISFEKELICDTALYGRTPKDDSLPCYTLSNAMSAWWRWKIPLKEIYGNWYVFSQKFQSISDAKKEFSEKSWIDINTIWEIHFSPWYNSQSWYKNTLSIGLSAGFVEPLEATWIYFSCKQLELLGDFIYNGILGYCDSDICEYNTELSKIFHEVKNFIVFHYATSPRRDTDFWRYYKDSNNFSTSYHTISVLAQNIIPYSQSKNIAFNQSQRLFKSESWLRIMIWNNWLHNIWKQNMSIPKNKLKELLEVFQRKMQFEMMHTLDHREYLNYITSKNV